MKIKKLIKELQKIAALNPDAIVCVREYNGWDDSCRPIKKVSDLDRNRLSKSQLDKVKKNAELIQVTALD